MTAVTEDAFRKEDVAVDVLQELQEKLAEVGITIQFMTQKTYHATMYSFLNQNIQLSQNPKPAKY